MNSQGIRPDLRWLAACLGIGAALRLFRLGHQSLWTDELISIGLATYTGGAEFWRGLLRDVHGPFNSALLHVWYPLGGSESWWRLLYAIPSIFVIPLFYRLGADLYGERAGRAACVAAALSPFLVWYSQEIRSYAWCILWITAALVVFVRIWDDRAAPRSWWLLAILVALGVLTNYATVFLLAALTLAVLLRRPFAPGLAIRWAGVLGFTALVFAPWFVDWFQRMSAERLFLGGGPPLGVPLREASGFSLVGIPFALWTFVFGYTLGPSLHDLHLDRSLRVLLPHTAVLAAGAVVVAWGGWFGAADAIRRRRAALVAILVLVPLAFATLLAVREIKTFHPRYLVAAFPVVLTLLAAGWSRTGALSLGIRALAAGLFVLSLGNHFFSPAYGKEASREVAEFVRTHEGSSDAVVVIYSGEPFRHYYDTRFHGSAPVYTAHKRTLRTDDEMREYVARASEGRDRVWLVLSRWWEVAPEDRIRGIFEEEFDETGRWEFPGIKLTRYEERAT